MRKSPNKYFSRDGKDIDHAQWYELRKDKDYCNVRKFQNDKVMAEIVWSGMVIDPDNTFTEYYKNYVIYVCNFGSDGKARPDPILNGTYYPNEEVAVTAYEKFLIKWTASHIDENGNFIDVDNEAKPPPPPNLDAPMTSVTSINLGAGDDGLVW